MTDMQNGFLKTKEEMRALVPEFIGWKEAVERLEKIQQSLFSALEDTLHEKNRYEFLPAWAFLLELRAGANGLKILNSPELNCAVPWEKTTGLPSLPSMSADALKWAGDGENSDAEKAIIRSFREWTLIGQGKIDCCCGVPGFAGRRVEYSQIINHSLKADDGGVLIAQFMAIQSDDVAFIENHFSKRNGNTRHTLFNPSKVLPKTNIVWRAVNRMAFPNGTMDLKNCGAEHALEFYNPDPAVKWELAEWLISFSRGAAKHQKEYA